tara:strand:+ start:43 stop:489 length:447 start_codon:yes stop_codon:yes gene_type:complete
MGWQMAVVAGLGVMQASQQKAYGKFNQAVQNRNADVKEQDAEILDSKLTLDLATFDKKFRELEGNTIVQTAKSGVTQGGTASRIRLANLTQAEVEKNKMKYDTEIGKSKVFEEANFLRIGGQIAKQQANIAAMNTITSTGTSLLKMKG